jgi:hypothetical protein
MNYKWYNNYFQKKFEKLKTNPLEYSKDCLNNKIYKFLKNCKNTLKLKYRKLKHKIVKHI